MRGLSRRALARYAADQLLAGKSANSVAQYLAAALIESGSASEIDYLIGDIASELEQRKKLAIGRVTSATPLGSELKSKLKARIKQATGAKSVLLEETVDESVIGGVRIEIANRVWDSTIARRLTDLKEAWS